MPRHLSERAQESLDRREREDTAVRLRDEIPGLESLKLEITQGSTSSGSAKHTRTIVVERAPALFEIACIDRSCKGGGHDVTRAIMSALRSGQVRLEGEDSCRGSLGSAECKSVLRYVGTAIYRL